MAHNEMVMKFLHQHFSGVGGNSIPGYRPTQDAANFGVPLLEELRSDLFPAEGETREPVVQELIDKFSITDDELAEAYDKFIKANNNIVGKGRYETVNEGFEKSGYAAVRPEVKLVMEGLLGRHFLGVFWYSVRSYTLEGEEPCKYTLYNTMDNLMKKALTASRKEETDDNEKD